MKKIVSLLSLLTLFSFLFNHAFSQCYDLQTCYLQFDDGSGDNVSDIQNQHPAKLVNNPSWVVRSNGTAVSFNGSDQYASIENSSDFNWGADSSFSIELWVKLIEIDENYKVLVGRDQVSSTHWWIGVEDTTGIAVFYLYNEIREGHSLSSETMVADGKWHHIAAVRNGLDETTRLYIDGAQEDSLIYTYNQGFASNSDIDIANLNKSGDRGFLFKGELDELAFYSRALTPFEVNRHYTMILDGEGYCGAEKVLPKITSTPYGYARIGKNYTYNVKAKGIPTPTYALSKYPAGMEINPQTGELTWLANESGIHSVEILATNGGDVHKQSFLLQVIEPCVEGLVSYYSLDDGKGTTPTNEISYHKSILFNNPEWDNGAIGGALVLDGTNQYMKIDSHDDFNWPEDGSFSIELLCKYNSIKTKHQVMIGRDKTDDLHWWVGAEQNTGKVMFYLFDQGLKASSMIHDNQWHHVAVVRNGQTSKTSLFIDGVKEDSLIYDYGKDYSAMADIYVGSLFYNKVNSFFFQGCLDEIGLYELALKDEEVLEHYLKFKEGITNCEQLRIKASVSSEPVTETQTGESYTYQVIADGIPSPGFKLINSPAGMTVSTSGLIEWEPGISGEYEVDLEVSNYVFDTIQSFTISVIETCLKGMITYYRFDEGTGVAPENEVGYHNAGIYYQPLWTEGWIGSALSFGGDNNVMVIDHHSDFDWEKDGSFSIELLCKVQEDSKGTRVMIGRNETDGPHWWLGMLNESSVASFYISNIGISGKKAINDNQWHHIAIVRDGKTNTSNLYVDGDLDASDTYLLTKSLIGSVGLNLGSLYSNEIYDFLFDGTLDEVAIFSRALSAEEVKDHFNLIVHKNGYCEYPIMEPIITIIPPDKDDVLEVKR